MTMNEEFDGAATNLFGRQLEDLNWVLKWPIKTMKEICKFFEKCRFKERKDNQTAKIVAKIEGKAERSLDSDN